jgi:Ni/Fe-hydrogenase subunit HybB-like protein
MTTIRATTAGIPPFTPAGVREAALRPFGRAGRGYWLLAAVLTAVVAAGLFAWIVQIRRGLGSAGYNDQAFWSIYEADLVAFIGVSYGGAVISAVLRLTGADWRAPLTRLAEGTAVVTVLIGGAFVFPHLGRVDRVWELVTQPSLSSPIFWDFVAIATYTVASIVFFALPLVPDMAIMRGEYAQRLGRRSRLYAAISRGWVGAPRQRRVLQGALGIISIMIIPLAVSVHSVLSWAFSLTSRPWWHESIWAPYFVVAALYSGVALVILVVAGFRRAYHLEAFITERHFKRLGFILAAFAAAYLYLTFSDILPGAYVGEPDTAAVFHELLIGRFAAYFWIFVAAGGLVPLLLVALRRTRTVPGIVAAAALVVPAMWLKRMLMVTDPGTYNRITGTFGTYHFTWISITVTLAGLAAVVLLLMLMFRVVPLLSVDEIEQIQHTRGQAEGTEPATRDDHPQARQPTGDDPGEAARPAETPQPDAGSPPAGRRHWYRLFRTTRAAGAVLLLLTGLGILLAQTTAPASAAAPKPPAATITITATEAGSGLHLTATLSGPGDKPLAKATVQFLQFTTEFGPSGRLVPLGSAATDKHGTARLTYQPTVTGTQKFVAKYTGGAAAGPATANTTIAVTSAHSVYQPSHKPLAGVGKATVAVLLAIVALVWLTLAVQVTRVRRACRSGGTG